MADSCPDNADATPRACETINRLIQVHINDLIDQCRRRIVSCPALEKLIERFDIVKSDEWLRQAISVFRVSALDFGGAAAEWHNEVGELNFATGLNISDASQILAILRDAVHELIWGAFERDELSAEEVRQAESCVFKAFDNAVATQASAYVRKSQRHLSEINHQLELRQKTFERDLALAELVQRRFIPDSFKTEHFRAVVRYEPTTGVGGDHAGLFPVSPDLCYITICDVTGHGIASALVAEIVSSHLRPVLRGQENTGFEQFVQPLTIIRMLNELFHEQFQPLAILLSSFVAMVDYQAKTITYAGGGHPPPILQCCSSHNLRELRSQNIMLGATEDCVVGTGQDVESIHPGDRIVFYTDGIIEANDRKGNMLGVEGLREILRNNYDTAPNKLADEIVDTALSLSGGNPADDMTVILLDIVKEFD